MRNIYGTLLLLLSANLMACSSLQTSCQHDTPPACNPAEISTIYNDSIDSILMEAGKVRAYDILGIAEVNDTLLKDDSIFNYKIKKNMGLLNSKDQDILTFIIADPNLLDKDYAPVRQSFHPDFILEFFKKKQKAYMLFSFGSEEIGVSDSHGNIKFYKMRNRRVLARWASMVFPNEEYYKKLTVTEI